MLRGPQSSTTNKLSLVDMTKGANFPEMQVPGKITNPHDVAVSKCGEVIAVAELNPPGVKMFEGTK